MPRHEILPTFHVKKMRLRVRLALIFGLVFLSSIPRFLVLAGGQNPFDPYRYAASLRDLLEFSEFPIVYPAFALLSIPFTLFADPLISVMLTAVTFASLSAIPVYLIGEKIGGMPAGLFSGLVYAFSALLLNMLSRGYYANALSFFFLMWLIYEILGHSKSRTILVPVLLLAIALTHHTFTLPVTLLFYAICSAVLVLFREFADAKVMVVGGVLFATVALVGLSSYFLPSAWYNAAITGLQTEVNIADFLATLWNRLLINGYYDAIFILLAPAGLFLLKAKARLVFLSLFLAILATNLLVTGNIEARDRISFFYSLPAVFVVGRALAALWSDLPLTLRARGLSRIFVLLLLLLVAFQNVTYVHRSTQYFAAYVTVNGKVAEWIARNPTNGKILIRDVDEAWLRYLAGRSPQFLSSSNYPELLGDEEKLSRLVRENDVKYIVAPVYFKATLCRIFTPVFDDGVSLVVDTSNR